MRKGLMQDYANQIAQMFVGYQIDFLDLPRLTAVGTGHLQVELLEDTSYLNGEAVAPFQITEAVRSWYLDALARDRLSADFVRAIGIDCAFDIAKSETEGRSMRLVRLDCTVELVAENGIWTGRSLKDEKGELQEDGSWFLWDA